MRYINPVRIYKFLLDFTWYSFIVIIGVLLLINIFSIAFDGIVRSSGFIKLDVQQKNLSLSKFSELFDFLVSKPSHLELRLSRFKISFITQTFIILYISASVIISFISLFQIKLLRDFLKKILNRQIFTTENTNKLYKVAYLELVTIPLSLLFSFLMVLATKDSHVLNSNYEFVPDYVECFQPIIRALEYFIFSGIFAFGLKLKQENDLTI
ncbi:MULTISPECIES: DUF2975 domain-containing protein [unclassified Pedobacter]|uniref:DUF2975 domain-containing protein n=1 Tax=unclassified Pedobacter TaxID=2628915 RepID=UPI001E2CB6B3|nr:MULTISPECIES: DUF2975 domain-containing protein [unclassified Pedobacter]